MFAYRDPDEISPSGHRVKGGPLAVHKQKVSGIVSRVEGDFLHQSVKSRDPCGSRSNRLFFFGVEIPGVRRLIDGFSEHDLMLFIDGKVVGNREALYGVDKHNPEIISRFSGYLQYGLTVTDVLDA